jgi:hypothetical protein
MAAAQGWPKGGEQNVACDMARSQQFQFGAGWVAARCSSYSHQDERQPSIFVDELRKMVRNPLGGKADFSYWQCYGDERRGRHDRSRLS